MADPFTLLVMAKTGLDIFSGIKQGQEQKEAYNESADAEILATAINKRNYEKKTSALLGTARARRAVSGIVMNTGSALLVDEATVREAATQMAEIDRQGKARAAALRKGGQVAAKAGVLNAVGSAFQGASILADRGVFDGD